MNLIIATSSRFARKARIALIEKSVPHEIVLDVPWNARIVAPTHNSLGKIPSLILNDGTSIYDSSVIVQYLEAIHPESALLPADPLERVWHLHVEALADDICDAIVLLTIESPRKPSLQSNDWTKRQQAKVDASVSELARMYSGGLWFAESEMGLADIAAGCTLGYLDIRLNDHPWRNNHPVLASFSKTMVARQSFQLTRPVAQQIDEIG